jgi:5S rRNA maturation endonuclease (ribonuclease M5)
MIILTDLDSEGRRLASKYVRFLTQEGVKPSLSQRKRLSEASRGVFLHIENLGRFALSAENLAELSGSGASSRDAPSQHLLQGLE